MSTQFTLYALSDDGATSARRYMRTSLGYGERNINEVINAAAFEQRNAALSSMTGGRDTRYDVFDSPHFVVDGDHTMHDDDMLCIAHTLVRVIGHDLPELTGGLAHAVLGTIPEAWSTGWVLEDPKHPGRVGIPVNLAGDGKVRRRTPIEFREAFSGWLEGARGRLLWYCFV